MKQYEPPEIHSGKQDLAPLGSLLLWQVRQQLQQKSSELFACARQKRGQQHRAGEKSAICTWSRDSGRV